jgi:hypothetical protein
MEGYLAKKGRGQSVSFIRPWAMRFFVLDEELSELRYYEKDTKTKCKGKLTLKGVQVCEGKDGDKKFCFELHAQQESGVLVLSAPDQSAKDAWMVAFSKFSKGGIRASMVAPGVWGWQVSWWGLSVLRLILFLILLLFHSLSLSVHQHYVSACPCRDQLPADPRRLFPRPGDHTRTHQDHEVWDRR